MIGCAPAAELATSILAAGGGGTMSGGLLRVCLTINLSHKGNVLRDSVGGAGGDRALDLPSPSWR